MNTPLQQSKSWQKLQDDLGETTIFEEVNDYTILAIVKQTKFGCYLYLPYGPALHPGKKLKNSKKSAKNTTTQTPATFKKAAKAAYQALERLAKQKNAIFIRIEPQAAETANFWRNLPNSKKTKDLSPKETWVLDITPEKSDILHGFSQATRTRYNQFAKKGLSVTSTKNPEEIKHLVTLQHKLARIKKIGTFSENYLKTELKQDVATLYLVHYEEKIIAASLFFDFEDTRFYMQSAADMEFKKLPGTVALLTTALFDAKDAGLKKFDFWGIAPTDASGNVPKDHPWAGFTAFKKSFGGYEVDYCGTFDLIFKPVPYRLYSLARRGNRFLRKITQR